VLAVLIDELIRGERGVNAQADDGMGFHESELRLAPGDPAVPGSGGDQQSEEKTKQQQ